MLKQLPFYEVTGDHQTVGEFLGTTFRKNIQESIKKRRLNIPNYEKYFPLVKSYIDKTQDRFPKLVIESKAIAKASDIPFVEFFFQNTRELYELTNESNTLVQPLVDHCTVIAGFNKNKPIVGHNEDWSKNAIDQLYILKATIGETTFIGLNYNTVIPGVSASMNSHGLVQCINELYQDTQPGVPKNYIARAVLETKTLDEAENLIRNTIKASGFNHFLVQGKQVRDVEVLRNKVETQGTHEKPYVHTNHYLIKNLRNIEPYKSESSEARYIRAKEMVKDTMDKTDILDILMDTKNKEYPICRPEETIGSAIFLPTDLKAYFCYGNPTPDNFIEYDI